MFDDPPVTARRQPPFAGTRQAAEARQDDSVSARQIYVDKLPNGPHIHLLGESVEETRYNTARTAFRSAVANADNSKRNKKISIEIMQQMREIESYGFNFVPSLYVSGIIDNIEALVEKLK